MQRHLEVLEDVPLITDYTEVEFASALAIKLRQQVLTAAEAKEVYDVFMNHVKGGVYRKTPIRPEHYHRARDLIATFQYPLKGADALHLAVADLGLFELVTADKTFAEVATDAGIATTFLS